MPHVLFPLFALMAIAAAAGLGYRSLRARSAGSADAEPAIARMRWTPAGDPDDDRWMPDPNGRYVSSRCENECHAPIFELDFPVELDRQMLVLHKDVTIAHAHAVITYMASQDLAPFRAAEDFEQSQACEGFAGTYRVSERVHRLEIPLSVPAELVPSRKPGHVHLYLQTVVIWKQYAELLRRLAEAELISTAWCNASLRKKMAILSLNDERR